MSAKIRIMVFDDHPILRDGVINILKTQKDIEVVGEGSCYTEAIDQSKELHPDIIVLDISMPGGGIEAARDIHEFLPATRIIMLTASEDDKDVMSALQVGASAYILKGIGGVELIGIVRKVASGETYISPSIATAILGHTQNEKPEWLEKLNPRETEVLEYLSQGASNKIIAEKLFLSEKTIKHYVSNILHKLKVKNRVEAALMAQKLNK